MSSIMTLVKYRRVKNATIIPVQMEFSVAKYRSKRLPMRYPRRAAPTNEKAILE